MDFEIKKYNNSLKSDWDYFVTNDSKNTSFLFLRDFMDYHSDRFEDFSLLIYKNSKLISVLPANLGKENIYFSHQGLTYGGLVVKKDAKLQEIIEIFHTVLKYLDEHGIKKFVIKLMPNIYNSVPAEELQYVMFLLNAKLVRRDTTLCIHQQETLPYQERRSRSIKKARKEEFEISSGIEELERFWKTVLEPNLLEKHGVKPVHTLEEIKKLALAFPENIKQYNIIVNGKCVAGCTMFINNNVAHAQYISGTDFGRNGGFLDYLFDYLINNGFKEYQYFDFGICNEDNGKKINSGLLDWKEGFGARTSCHDFYEINPASYELLKSV